MPAARPEPPRGNAVTRRQVLGGAGLLLVTAACGRGSEQAEAGGDGGGGTGFPVSVEHKYGSAKIPARPQRVVTVGLTEQDYVLAAGVAPVGTREWFGDYPGALWPWARKKLGDRPLPEVLPTNKLDYEKVAALKPDVILGVNSGLTADEYETLSRIAPTVAQPGEYPDYGVPWQQLTRTVGRALGREKRATAYIPDIEKQFEQARRKHPVFQKSTGMLATSIDGTAYIYAEGPAPLFLQSLGLELPADAAALFGEDRTPVQLSLEKLEVLEADVLVLGVYGKRSNSIASKPVYQRLDVAQEGRDVILPEMSLLNGALSFGSVLSLPVALDKLVPRLADAVDGDPSTKVKPVPANTDTG